MIVFIFIEMNMHTIINVNFFEESSIIFLSRIYFSLCQWVCVRLYQKEMFLLPINCNWTWPGCGSQIDSLPFSNSAMCNSK